MDDHDYVFLWEEAAKQGHLEATCDLGYLYEQGFARKPPDLPKAEQYYSQACR